MQQATWTALLDKIYKDPRVAQLVNSRPGQYLSSRPFLALTVLVFGAMATLPVGLFVFFSLLTITVSIAGFIFFEVFLLCVGGLTLLCTLSGLAVLSVLISTIFNTCYSAIFSMYNGHTQRIAHTDRENEKGSEDERGKETHKLGSSASAEAGWRDTAP